MNWLNRLLGRSDSSSSSAQIAKNRLQVVLSYDRTNLTPELLGLLQDEIVVAISRHLDIDRETMTFSTQRGDKGDHLVADIPIRGVRPARMAPATTPVPASGPVQSGSVNRTTAGTAHKKKHKKR